jgi:O-antigen/teichoic acid export membrane protein
VAAPVLRRASCRSQSYTNFISQLQQIDAINDYMSPALPPTRRQAALKGGVYLFGRQIVSIGLKFVGVMLITRVLGPAGYGAYLSAFNIYTYATLLGYAGVGVYLLRYHGEVPEAAYGTAYSVLLAMSLLLIVGIQLSKGLLAAWINVPGFDQVIRVIIFALPFQLISSPAMIRLERQLNYRKVAMLEMLAQFSYYIFAVPMVRLGFGPVSLGYAWLVQAIVICVMTHATSKTYPRFRFDPQAAKQMARYATTFSLANWIWQLRILVNPMIVGPMLGAQAVGLVGMTIGLLEMLSIIRVIAWRLSVAVLGQVQTDLEKLRKSVTEGMELQTLAAGSILLGFAWTGHIIIPLLFGARWLGVMDIYPYVALSYLTTATFNMHSAVLSLINRNIDVAIFAACHILLLVGTTALAVPAVGILGYGYGEIATLPAYFLMHLFLVRAIGVPDYRLTVLWWSAAAIGLFWRQFGLWAIAVPFVALAMPLSLTRLRFFYSQAQMRR